MSTHVSSISSASDELENNSQSTAITAQQHLSYIMSLARNQSGDECWLRYIEEANAEGRFNKLTDNALQGMVRFLHDVWLVHFNGIEGIEEAQEGMA